MRCCCACCMCAWHQGVALLCARSKQLSVLRAHLADLGKGWLIGDPPRAGLALRLVFLFFQSSSSALRSGALRGGACCNQAVTRGGYGYKTKRLKQLHFTQKHGCLSKTAQLFKRTRMQIRPRPRFLYWLSRRAPALASISLCTGGRKCASQSCRRSAACRRRQNHGERADDMGRAHPARLRLDWILGPKVGSFVWLHRPAALWRAVHHASRRSPGCLHGDATLHCHHLS